MGFGGMVNFIYMHTNYIATESRLSSHSHYSRPITLSTCRVQQQTHGWESHPQMPPSRLCDGEAASLGRGWSCPPVRQLGNTHWSRRLEMFPLHMAGVNDLHVGERPASSTPAWEKYHVGARSRWILPTTCRMTLLPTMPLGLLATLHRQLLSSGLDMSPKVGL